MLALCYFTYKDLLHDRWRSLLTIFSLALVVAGYLLLASLSRAFQILSRQTQMTNNLVILSADAIDPMESSLDDEILAIVQEFIPNQIQYGFPTLFRHMNIGGRILQVRGVPLEEMPSSLRLTLCDGQWLSGSRQILVGEEIARVASWKVGSTVNIYGVDFQVTGLVCAAENNLSAIWMDYPEGQLLFGMQHGFQIAYLPLVKSADPESVRALLQAEPSISGHYTVYLENAVSEGYNQLNHNLVTLSSIMALVSLLAITFGIYNSTGLSLTERNNEIGLLQVIGLTWGRLRDFLFTRALVLTLAGYGLGWVVLDLYLYLRNLNSHMGSSEAPLNLNLTLSSSLLGLGLASAFAFLGVWLTSIRFEKLNPLKASD